MRIREANEIEYEYISKVLIDDNINVENVIIHAVIEQNDSVKYAIEVHHEERVTLFTGTKEKIDNIFLERNYLSKQESFNFIKKMANDCKILDKYKDNFDGFLIQNKSYTFIVAPRIISSFVTREHAPYNYYEKASRLNSIIKIELNTGNNHNKSDYMYVDKLRIAHDSSAYNYMHKQDVDIEYFRNSNDYFAISTICGIQKDSFEYLCSIYNEFDKIRNLEYKINTSDNVNSLNDKGNKSHYRKMVKMYMNIDLEEAILLEIELKYADYIKVP